MNGKIIGSEDPSFGGNSTFPENERDCGYTRHAAFFVGTQELSRILNPDPPY